MNPPLADTLIPGGGLVVGLAAVTTQALTGLMIDPPVTPVILIVSFAPGVPPE
jgi:hypothetical protein